MDVMVWSGVMVEMMLGSDGVELTSGGLASNYVDLVISP